MLAQFNKREPRRSVRAAKPILRLRGEGLMPQSKAMQSVFKYREQEHLLWGIPGLPIEEVIETLRSKGQRAFRIARLRWLRCPQ